MNTYQCRAAYSTKKDPRPATELIGRMACSKLKLRVDSVELTLKVHSTRSYFRPLPALAGSPLDTMALQRTAGVTATRQTLKRRDQNRKVRDVGVFAACSSRRCYCKRRRDAPLFYSAAHVVVGCCVCFCYRPRSACWSMALPLQSCLHQ